MDPAAHRSLNQKIRQFFDDLAPQWDAMVGPGHGRNITALLAPLALGTAQSVLDMGAGSGVLWPMLGERLTSSARYTAVDLSPAMLRKARENHGDDARRAVLVADGQELPFTVGAFDWVLCNSCFPHFNDQTLAMREMGRVLESGGTLVICHGESRKGINELHRRAGGVVGGHELPEDEVMIALAKTAGLTPKLLLDGAKGYLFLAEKG
ncbi:MAG: class I SAM-dependent methyltransferase [Candidatus Hydrogenedentes bacterium]|nr:class I SAM-dependent methyltransferase [Candidatus Hydrogenedentota bacterium]